MSRPAPEALRIAETARTIALQMMSERGPPISQVAINQVK
jgi:hypothetical protein